MEDYPHDVAFDQNVKTDLKLFGSIPDQRFDDAKHSLISRYIIFIYKYNEMKNQAMVFALATRL